MGINLLNFGIFESRREPYGIDENTVLMLHLNNNVSDVSDSEHVITNSNVTFDSGTKKWGSHSGVFNGEDAYLESVVTSDFSIASSNSDDWTIDLWVKFTNHEGIEYFMINFQDGTHHWIFQHTHGTGLYFDIYNGAFITGGEIEDTDWHWITMCKVADEYGIYKDGTQIGYAQNTNVTAVNGKLYIGSSSAPAAFFDGYMDEIRIQHSNIFNASPLAVDATGYPDTIDIPTKEYTR